jgi:hypothetical protein
LFKPGQGMYIAHTQAGYDYLCVEIACQKCSRDGWVRYYYCKRRVLYCIHCDHVTELSRYQQAFYDLCLGAT